MSLPRWLAVLAQIGPTILSVTPLAPIAPAVVAGITLAESLAGATGEQKRALVQQIAATAARAANAQAGHQILDPQAVHDTAGQIISSVVDTTNLIHGLPVPASS